MKTLLKEFNIISGCYRSFGVCEWVSYIDMIYHIMTNLPFSCFSIDGVLKHTSFNKKNNYLNQIF